MKRGFGDHSPLTEKINEWSDILVERERRVKVKEVGAEVEDVGCLNPDPPPVRGLSRVRAGRRRDGTSLSGTP